LWSAPLARRHPRRDKHTVSSVPSFLGATRWPSERPLKTGKGAAWMMKSGKRRRKMGQNEALIVEAEE
jgi:hypothetical protein